MIVVQEDAHIVLRFFGAEELQMKSLNICQSLKK